MPYISQEKRLALGGWAEFFEGCIEERRPDTGELNYLITKLMHTWLGTTPNYADYNEAIGTLECAKLELYRRGVAPYEDLKIAANGDVV